VIEVEHLSKRFRKTVAVDDLSFKVSPGTITGFLGPNGAGKTTTLRVILGLVRPTAGRATVMERLYGQLDNPTRQVGAVLEASDFHPGRSGRNHLRVLATATGIPTPRVDEVLEIVDLTDAARRRAGGYSLGMRQRLSIAGALLGEPAVLYKEKINYKLAGGAGYAPHQDAPAYPFIDVHVSCMVAVDDSTERHLEDTLAASRAAGVKWGDQGGGRADRRCPRAPARDGSPRPRCVRADRP